MKSIKYGLVKCTFLKVRFKSVFAQALLLIWCVTNAGVASADTITSLITLTVLEERDAQEVVDHVRQAGLQNCKQLVEESFDELVIIQLQCDSLRDVEEARQITETALTSGLIPFHLISHVSISMKVPAWARE